MSASNRHAPGSLRAAKTSTLEPRTGEAPSRRSDQHRVWDEVERQSIAHGVDSETSALQDVQSEVADHMADELDRIEPVPGQIGVVCTVGDEVVGMDLFDKPTTLETYLRGIIAGHALDAPVPSVGLVIRSGPSSASSPRSTPPPETPAGVLAWVRRSSCTATWPVSVSLMRAV